MFCSMHIIYYVFVICPRGRYMLASMQRHMPLPISLENEWCVWQKPSAGDLPTYSIIIRTHIAGSF